MMIISVANIHLTLLVEQGVVFLVALSFTNILAFATVAQNPKVAVKVNIATIFFNTYPL